MRSPLWGLKRHFTLIALCLNAGCVKAYEPPLPTEPHALLKIRRVFHSSPGERREVSIFIEDTLASDLYERWDAVAAGTTHERVRLGVNHIEVRSAFWHTEQRWVIETYTEQVPYTDTETYSTPQQCAPGQPSGTGSVSHTRTVTKYKTVHKTRLVLRWVDVQDDFCQRRIAPYFQANGTYLLQYTYTGRGTCKITCLQQFEAATPEGSVFRPCLYPRSSG